MEKQSLSIQEAEKKSLKRGAANRILQLLQKQRYSNNENAPKRWVWELCQNAKDTCNGTGKVKICIDFDDNEKIVVFKHNGEVFSEENIFSIINQSTSKGQGEKSEKKSGKFGTGFITTHLLSEKVNITGILEAEESYSKFCIHLDRTGKNVDKIIEAMDQGVEDLQNCIPMDISDFDADNYNTEFEYKLNEYGVQVVKDGMNNLKVSAPFVLSMLPCIKEIMLEKTGEKFWYSQELPCGLKNAAVSEIIMDARNGSQKIYVLKVSEGNVTIMIALECEKGVTIKKFPQQQSKLFCDFPLIGTEDFLFPVLISSADFNPTEPRDGIFLTCNNKEKIDDEVQANRDIIEIACKLYQQLLEYAVDKRWGGIYNITQISDYRTKEWYDEEWIKNIIEKCKAIILHTPIVYTEDGSMKELLDYWGDEQIFIISDENEAVREKIWYLLSCIMPERIPQKKDLHEWYHSLWPSCNRYTFDMLLEQVSTYGNIDKLEAELRKVDWQAWLTDCYDLIDENENWQVYIKNHQIDILPNQNGEFCSVGKLSCDFKILEEYKDILMDMGIDIKSQLLHLNIRCREWFHCDKIDNNQILELIEKYLDQAERRVKESVYLKIIYMYNNTFKKVNAQKQICSYAKNILGLTQEMHEVGKISEKILQEAMKYTATSVADKISECKTINGLARYLVISEKEATGYLAGFVEFVVKQGWDNLINKVTEPILPNQNGDFTVKENIFIDGEMDEILKEIACFAGYDIRAELLIKDVFLELPGNRKKTNKDIAACITQFVEDNRNTKKPEIRNAFNKLLLWIKDNQSEAENILPVLSKNKHYLYDDDDIANNIRQAETFKDIMSKYGVVSTEQLEAIIRKNSEETIAERDLSRETVTEEVLLQYGIASEEALEQAFSDSDFASLFIRKSKHEPSIYEYVKKILERAQKNILAFLERQEEYDLSDKQKIADTIFIVKKNGKQIYVLARPSDGGEVRLYYRTEMDILDYSTDWELWVEDGKTMPQKITFGKIIKLTGLNRIPLRGK